MGTQHNCSGNGSADTAEPINVFGSFEPEPDYELERKRRLWRMCYPPVWEVKRLIPPFFLTDQVRDWFDQLSAYQCRHWCSLRMEMYAIRLRYNKRRLHCDVPSTWKGMVL